MKWKKCLLSDFFDIKTTKSVDKNKIELKNEAPYDFIGRTSTGWGIQGVVDRLDFAPNPKDSFSLVQVGETVALWREKEWYASQNLFLLQPKLQKIKDVFLYFQTVINKEMSLYGKDYNNYPTMKSLNETYISLPVKTKYIPDFNLMSEIIGGGGISMSNIDTSSWKKFKLDDIFKKVDTVKIPLKKGNCPVVPAELCTVLKNKISVSANGDFCAFWHDSDFTILQDAYALEGNGFELTEKIALFLISVMMHSFSSKYNWNNKSGWEKLRNDVILLPVKGVKEEIDWEYMQERITELEQERITELEQYLIATGLNDYELTDEDKDILATKLTDGVLRNSTSGNGCLKEARMFKVVDIFDVKNSKNILKSDVDFTKQEHPYVTAQEGNNSIMAYVAYDESFLDKGGCIFIGGKTLVISYQKEDFFSNDSHNLLLYVKETCNEHTQEYMISALYKALKPKYSWNGSISYKKIQNDELCLPIQTDINNTPVIDQNHTYHPDGYIPDWTYMEKYIRAIEKVVIKDVVDYKDSIIAKTKEIVA